MHLTLDNAIDGTTVRGSYPIPPAELLFVKIKPTGLSRYSFVPSSAGFCVDARGRVLIERGVPSDWNGCVGYPGIRGRADQSPVFLKLYPSPNYGAGLWLTDETGFLYDLLLTIPANGGAWHSTSLSREWSSVIALDGEGFPVILP